MRNAASLFLVILFTGSVWAGGFQVNLQGAKNNAMGHVGTGLNLDASSVFFNPGAMGFLPNQHTINVGASMVFGHLAYEEAEPTLYTARNVNEDISTPLFLYANMRFNKDSKWNLGIALNNPFGSSLKYEDDWAGQFIIREISLRTFAFQPTLGYKVNDRFSVGVGSSIYAGSLKLRRGIPVTNQSDEYGEVNLEGAALAYGANIGIMYKPKEDHYVGISYRSPVKVSLDEGTAEFTVPSSITDSFAATKFATEITLPQVVNVGLGWQAHLRWLIAVDVNWTGWSSYDTLKFDFDVNSTSLEDTELPKEFKSSFAFRVGAQYQPLTVLFLRAGFYYDMTPVQDGFLSPESPDSDRIGITWGLSFDKPGFSIDASVMHVKALDRTGGSDYSGFYGTYKVSAIVPTIGIHLNLK